MSNSKRLSDAEAAAEFYCEWAEYLWWEGKRHPESVSRHDQSNRVEVLERFATLPHYDEEQK